MEGRILIIVESPNKISTITKILKDAGWKNFIVKASMGHISEIKDGGSYHNSGIEPLDNFKTNYVVSSSKKEVVKQLIEQVKAADTVYICSDPDREGEAIAWSLKKFLKIPKEKCKRATFHEITKQTVLKALENPRDLDTDLVEAAQSRQVLDKIVGYRLSPIARRNVYCPSVGRCQSAGLKLLVNREKEIKDFKPITFYDLFLYFSKNSHNYKAKYIYVNKETDNKIIDKQIIEKVKNTCKPDNYKIIDIQCKDRINNPKPAFTTSTFQQEVSNKLGISIKTAMNYAQKLFEGISIKGEHIALTTYIRTDSSDMAPEFIPVLKTFIETNYGKEYYKVNKKSSKNELAQDGHECLRVVDLSMTANKLSNYIDDDKLIKVYDLIYRRTVASMMAPSIINEVIYTIDNNKNLFEFSSKELKFDGFKKVYTYKEEDTEEVSKDSFEEGELLLNTKLEDIEKTTQPPSRYKEATFINTLEQSGIGRPSTFASILETLLDKNRDYCIKEKGYLVPTEKGIKLSEFLDKSFSNIININYTAKLEEELDTIAKGKLSKLEFLNGFYNELEDTAKNMIRPEKQTPKEHIIGPSKCPVCGASMYLREGKFGKFYGCSKYPRCKGILKIED